MKKYWDYAAAFLMITTIGVLATGCATIAEPEHGNALSFDQVRSKPRTFRGRQVTWPAKSFAPLAGDRVIYIETSSEVDMMTADFSDWRCFAVECPARANRLQRKGWVTGKVIGTARAPFMRITGSGQTEEKDVTIPLLRYIRHEEQK